MRGKILVIEDEMAINDLISMNLEVTGYEVVSCLDGLEAEETLKKEADFDLALVDIMLPGKDGFALLPELKAAGIPVIFLTALGAVAACDAVERTCGVRPQIKWTNDLVLNGKKLSGTLTELSLEGESGALQYAVIGIGVNCNNTLEDFPPELRDVATSLYLETGKRVQRAALAAALIEELDKLYAALQSGDTASYLTSYRRDCLTLGREVQLLWQNVKEKVTALDVDDQFGLVVRRADGTVETIRTGEVSVRGLYGYVE